MGLGTRNMRDRDKDSRARIRAKQWVCASCGGVSLRLLITGSDVSLFGPNRVARGVLASPPLGPSSLCAALICSILPGCDLQTSK